MALILMIRNYFKKSIISKNPFFELKLPEFSTQIQESTNHSTVRNDLSFLGLEVNQIHVTKWNFFKIRSSALPSLDTKFSKKSFGGNSTYLIARYSIIRYSEKWFDRVRRGLKRKGGKQRRGLFKKLPPYE